MKVLGADRSGSCLLGHSREDGGGRAGRREEGGEHRCGGAARRDLADAVNF